MSDQQTPALQPDLDEAPGWVITDPDGNIVDSGPLTVAQPAFLVGDTDNMEGEQ